jgi:cytosine deaminase
MADLLLRDGRIWGHEGAGSVLVRDGVVAAVGPGVDAPDAEVVDLAGRLVLPGLVDAHAHLDKTMYGGPWTPHTAQDTLADRIANERGRRAALGLPHPDYMRALLSAMVAAGTAHLRTHTDVDPEVGLKRVHAVRAVAETMADRIAVTQVAFPQYGILATPGTADLLEQALREGVEGIGGIDPAGVDRDPVGHLDVVFGLADRYGSTVDLHLHDGGALGAWELDLIAERTETLGLGGRVTVSHAYALGQVDPTQQTRIAERLARAGVAVTTAAVYDFPVPPLRTLGAAGVTVAAGNDCVRDQWGPYGAGDMLDRAMHLAYRSIFRRDEDIALALDAATYGGAAALGLPAYGLRPGAPAHLVVVPAGGAAEAVVTHPPRDLVLHHGRVVARAGALA